MTILVTGAAGFIGYHVCLELLDRRETVLGLDNLNAYYDPRLKEDRLSNLRDREGFTFLRADLADLPQLTEVTSRRSEIRGIVHLAAQAGVRHSLTAPFDYTASNVTGHLAVLELCRQLPELSHLVYASSSSVYGANTKSPFSVDDRVDRPTSLYAATKRAGELMAHAYSHLYGIPSTGLRFFTVYGPWGRPDMAAYLFADAILRDEPIKLFNSGAMQRDFTYIDDIVRGVVDVYDRPPVARGAEPPARVLNIGNNRPEDLGRFVQLIEGALGRSAKIEMLPMQMGDVRATHADIDHIHRLTGFEPTTPIEVGIPKFIDWFLDYRARRRPEARPPAGRTGRQGTPARPDRIEAGTPTAL